MLLKGSGDAFTASRAAAFVPWDSQRDSATQQERQQADPAVKVPESSGGEHRPRGNPDERMNGVPSRVDSRNLVGDELNQKQQASYPDDPPFAKNAQITGQVRKSKALE